MNGLEAIMSNLDKAFFALKVVPALIRQKCDLSMQCFRLGLPHNFQPMCIQSPGVILAIDLRQIKDRERSWIRSPCADSRSPNEVAVERFSYFSRCTSLFELLLPHSKGFSFLFCCCTQLCSNLLGRFCLCLSCHHSLASFQEALHCKGGVPWPTRASRLVHLLLRSHARKCPVKYRAGLTNE